MKGNRLKGFTLIELLVVIAIIAILAAVLFPVFAKVREKARQTSCSSNMKQLALSVLQYTQDYDETMPPALSDEPDWGGSAWCRSWIIDVQPYTKSLGIFKCPSDALSKKSDWQGDPVSYAANGLIGQGQSSWGYVGAFAVYQKGGGFWEAAQPTLSSFNRPGDTIMFAERHNDEGGNFVRYSVPIVRDWNDDDWRLNWVTGHDYHAASIPLPFLNWQYGSTGAVSVKHTGLANFTFCDGHVKSMLPAKTNPTGWGAVDNMWDRTRN